MLHYAVIQNKHKYKNKLQLYIMLKLNYFCMQPVVQLENNVDPMPTYFAAVRLTLDYLSWNLARWLLLAWEMFIQILFLNVFF